MAIYTLNKASLKPKEPRYVNMVEPNEKTGENTEKKPIKVHDVHTYNVRIAKYCVHDKV